MQRPHHDIGSERRGRPIHGQSAVDFRRSWNSDDSLIVIGCVDTIGDLGISCSQQPGTRGKGKKEELDWGDNISSYGKVEAYR